MDQDCVDAAVTSDGAIKRELEAQMFRCLSTQNSLMCDDRFDHRFFQLIQSTDFFKDGFAF